jgi:streptogramin lyase
VAGSDGVLWFTNDGNNAIGRITTTGKVTMHSGTGISGPAGITAGPDGALWFTNDGNNSIGRITTAGKITDYTGPGIADPRGIVVGPDGALWFTNLGNKSIGRITVPVDDHSAHLSSSLAAIRRHRAQGQTLQAIASSLNARAIPTAHGGSPWYTSTIRAVLRSEGL